MSKEYGLIIPGSKPAAGPPKVNLSKPSIFGSDSDSDNNAPKLRIKTSSIGPGANEKRMAKKIQAQALAEDPTVFQYDELYDDMESKREEEKKSKSNEVKKPKYINRLLEYAEKRKLENERRVERMVQKERELEGDEFKDKDSFVTSAYRQKLEAMRQAEEQEKRDEYLESIGDVTKQKDLDGFYRHIYEQKVGNKEISKDQNEKLSTTATTSKTKKNNSTKTRAYRKRRTSDEVDDEQLDINTLTNKKVHIQCNIDADSDFSIDSSDSETEKSVLTQTKEENLLDSDIKHELKAANAGCNDDNEKSKDDRLVAPQTKENIKCEDEPTKEDKPKKIKIDIWKKRTVGAVLDAALQRYYERKSTRNG